jgi:hypothetical protein
MEREIVTNRKWLLFAVFLGLIGGIHAQNTKKIKEVTRRERYEKRKNHFFITVNGGVERISYRDEKISPLFFTTTTTTPSIGISLIGEKYEIGLEQSVLSVSRNTDKFESVFFNIEQVTIKGFYLRRIKEFKKDNNLFLGGSVFYTEFNRERTDDVWLFNIFTRYNSSLAFSFAMSHKKVFHFKDKEGKLLFINYRFRSKKATLKQSLILPIVQYGILTSDYAVEQIDTRDGRMKQGGWLVNYEIDFNYPIKKRHFLKIGYQWQALTQGEQLKLNLAKHRLHLGVVIGIF